MNAMIIHWQLQRTRPIAVLFALLTLFATTVASAQESSHIGLKIRTVTAELRKQHELPADVKGAFVTAVEPGSPAAEKGIVAGEVVVRAGGNDVATAKAVATKIDAARESGAITLTLVNAKGERREVTVPIPKGAGKQDTLPPGVK